MRGRLIICKRVVALSRYQAKEPASKPDQDMVLKQVEQIETLISTLGAFSRKYEQLEKEILNGLDDKGSFEHAHRLLGEFLGFESKKVESDGSPDPWWTIANLCFVFEDHADAKPEGILDTKKARQVAGHPKWMHENVLLEKGTSIITVLVTPVKKASDGAKPHLSDVLLWSLDDFKKWAKNGLAVVRELRRKFTSPADLTWRGEAIELLKENKLDPASILKFLEPNRASKKLRFIK